MRSRREIPLIREPGNLRYSYLLVAQLTAIVLVPVLAGERAQPAIAASVAILLFAAALGAVVRERQVRLIAMLLAAPAILAAVVEFVTPGTAALLVANGCGILFLAFVTAVILRGVVTSGEVTTQTLYGAVTGYLLLGITWGWTYAMIEQLHPGSFRSLVKPDGHVVAPELVFLSFITLTSVGYGDIVPLSPPARSFAILEAIAGQMYLAVFVARLVGLHGQHRAP